MNQGWTYFDRVPAAAAGMTLLAYYTQRYRHSSEADWQRRIAIGQILVNGRKAAPEVPIELGQQLTYRRDPWQEPDCPLAFNVCYEDSSVLVVNKPAGLPVLPGANFLQHTLLWQVQQRCPSAFPVHRLGRGTSGLVLLAKTRRDRAHLSQQIRQCRVGKTYWAIVGDETIPTQFTVTQPIGKLPHPQLGYVYGAVSTTDPSGQWAKSSGQVLRREAGTSLVAVTILTGRPHQIRIHLAAIAHPLLADPLYLPGGLPRPDARPGDCGYFLHAQQLEFVHPTQGELSISCPPPWSFPVQTGVPRTALVPGVPLPKHRQALPE